ncbi:hypothetical protein [Rivibacter subsaxonicus]|uniref:Pyridoxamine 5'-phosphate oxidase n=1 Tax=Rivibacter subsaxonicus TaxID=457575 RepID=A0A4Q7VYY8_9BURK|nr:hypothetical protein [Rivibacter subsaxonicus]RZU02001.1 hypothetical protein EV670_0019 [Rivibacter subsaxonicus]
MDATPAPLQLDAATVTFIEGGVSIIVGSCGADGVPSVVRAVGCRVSADRALMTVLLVASQCSALLEQLRGGGPIAVVFTEPPTHRALQLKAPGATVAEATPTDWATATRHQQQFAAAIDALGFGHDFACAIHSWRPGDMVAAHFRPTEAYDQTPGPNAGSALKAACA